MEFEILYKKYYKDIFYYCRKFFESGHIVNHKELAEDFTQETFISAYKQWDKFESEQNIKRFLYKVVKNKVLNELSAIKTHAASHKEIVFLSKEGELPDYWAINSDVIGFIFSELQKLPPQCQKIFELYLKGVSSIEIAANLHITSKTALNQKLKAIGILKKKIILKFGYL